VEPGPASRAIAAVVAQARELHLQVDDAVVVHNSNKLALRLLPCHVFARTALVGQEVGALEIAVAQELSAVGAPAASLDPRVPAQVYRRDDIAVTFWTYYDAAEPDRFSAADHAEALRRLHVAMRTIDVEAPHFTERVHEAEALVADRHKTPALDRRDRELLLNTLGDAARSVTHRATTEQLLHGEPHSGNVLRTPDGLLFVDLETCCRGPVEFDVAHLPQPVSAHYPGVEQDQLQQCRRLILAMVAAWRWDIHDEFPDGHRYGRDLLALLHAGPPWPDLGALTNK
jgi:Phosphotransferase enzyme family